MEVNAFSQEGIEIGINDKSQENSSHEYSGNFSEPLELHSEAKDLNHAAHFTDRGPQGPKEPKEVVMDDAQRELQKILGQHLKKMQQKNSAFSLRSFARWLMLSPSAVSEIINGKRRVSRKMAEKIYSKIGLTDEDKQKALELFSAAKAKVSETARDLGLQNELLSSH